MPLEAMSYVYSRSMRAEPAIAKYTVDEVCNACTQEGAALLHQVHSCFLCLVAAT